MKKKLLVFLVTVALLSLVVPNAFATISENQKKELDGLYQQVFELRKQVIQKYVEAGELSSEKGNALIKELEKELENSRKQGFKPIEPNAGVGGGCGGGAGSNPGPSTQGTGYNMMGYSSELL